MRFTDRSRIEEWYQCPRKRYWGYEHLGSGLSKVGPPNIDKAYGSAFHEGADLVMQGKHWSDAAIIAAGYLKDLVGITVDGFQVRDEYGALLDGHLRAFDEFILPDLRREYDILAQETEMVLPFSGDLTYGTRLDLGLRSKSTGLVYNVEYKTDSSPSDIEMRMEFALQFMLESATLSAHLGEKVEGTIIIGIDKGVKRGPTEGDKLLGKTSGERRLSPLCYVYALGDGPYEFSLDYKKGKGWRRLPTWTLGLDWYEELKGLGFDMRSLFTQSTPILYDQEKFEHVRRQVTRIEQRINLGLILMKQWPDYKSTLDDFFGQNFSNCKNDGGYKKICPFIGICHLGEDPSDESLYRLRTVNHPIEETIHDI